MVGCLNNDGSKVENGIGRCKWRDSGYLTATSVPKIIHTSVEGEGRSGVEKWVGRVHRMARGVCLFSPALIGRRWRLLELRCLVTILDQTLCLPSAVSSASRER